MGIHRREDGKVLIINVYPLNLSVFVVNLLMADVQFKAFETALSFFQK